MNSNKSVILHGSSTLVLLLGMLMIYVWLWIFFMHVAMVTRKVVMLSLGSEVNNMPYTVCDKTGDFETWDRERERWVIRHWTSGYQIWIKMAVFNKIEPWHSTTNEVQTIHGEIQWKTAPLTIKYYQRKPSLSIKETWRSNQLEDAYKMQQKHKTQTRNQKGDEEQRTNKMPCR